jgi:hypothetical protein
MDPSTMYTLADVLAVAKIHPFYSDAKYPPTDEAICAARKKALAENIQARYPGRSLIKPLFNLLTLGGREKPGQTGLKSHSLLHKKDL